MSGIFLSGFSKTFLDYFIDDVSSNNNHIYAFLGRDYAWEDEITPDTEENNLEVAEFLLRDNIVLGKKITDQDLKYLIRNESWSSNTVYDFYDHRVSDLKDKNYYVINTNNQVYKCLYNNMDGPSTSEPLFMSNNTVELADGYVWKYMYSLTENEKNTFGNEDYIPVIANNDVIASSTAGTIDIILVEDQGEGYTFYETGLIQQVVSNTVFRIENTTSSSNDVYTDASIFIDQGTGSGSISEIVQYTSNNSGKFVVTANSLSLDTTSEYIISPRVKITGDGSDTIAYSVVDPNAQVLTNIVVQNPGSNYTFANVEIIANTIHGSGAVAEAIISPLNGHGSDPAKEFDSDLLSVSVEFDGSESNNVPVDISVRQAGILRNPLGFNSNTIYNDNVFNQYVEIEPFYAGGIPYAIGEVVVGQNTNAEGVVVQSNTSNLVINMNTKFTYNSSEVLIGSDSNIFANIQNLIDRDINTLTGDILFYKNFEPVSRSNDAKENIKLIFKV